MRTAKIQLLDNARSMAALCVFLLYPLLPANSFAAGPPPVLTVQPLDQTVLYGGTATFSVAAATSGTALSYQWYKDELLILDQLLLGETRTNLVLNNVGDPEVGQYFVRVINAGGLVDSRMAVLSVVTNSPPVASNDNYATSEDVPLVIPAAGPLSNDTDVNNQPLTAQLVTNVSQGSLSLSTNGSFTYTPASNFFGSDSFTYRASDGYPVILQQNNSGGNLQYINDGNEGAQSFRHGAAGGPSYMISRVILYLSRRSGGNANNTLNFSIGTRVNAGAIAGSSWPISTASITNTSQGSSFQTYAIVYGAPLGPFTAGTTYYLNLDNQTGQRVYVEYPDSNTYADGTYYDRGSNQYKDMRFNIYETIMSNPATVMIDVLPVDDPPTAVNDNTNTLEDVSVTVKVLANDSDPDGNPLTVTGAFTTDGTAVISGNDVLFTPSTNFNGPAVFTYTIYDGSYSATGRVGVAVSPVNDAPVASNDAYNCAEDIPLIILPTGSPPVACLLANDTDVDSNALSASLVSAVTHGTLWLNSDGSFAYLPEADYNGPDSFTYRASDGAATSNLATVTINVTPVNDPLRFTSQQMTANGFELHVSGPDASTYVISASANLTDWIPIYTNFMALGNMTFTDTSVTNNPIRFYRADAR